MKTYEEFLNEAENTTEPGQFAGLQVSTIISDWIEDNYKIKRRQIPYEIARFVDKFEEELKKKLKLLIIKK